MTIESILKQLFSAYVYAEVDDATVAIYMMMLRDIPPAELQMAVHQCIRTMKFLPTPSDILEVHRELKGGLIDQTAAEAWGSVEKAKAGVGSWGTPRFRNELTALTVEIMGWLNLCRSDKPGVDRAQFMRIYEDLAERAHTMIHMEGDIKAYFQANVRKRLESPHGNESRAIESELTRLGLLSDKRQLPGKAESYEN